VRPLLRSINAVEHRWMSGKYDIGTLNCFVFRQIYRGDGRGWVLKARRVRRGALRSTLEKKKNASPNWLASYVSQKLSHQCGSSLFPLPSWQGKTSSPYQSFSNAASSWSIALRSAMLELTELVGCCGNGEKIERSSSMFFES